MRKMKASFLGLFAAMAALTLIMASCNKPTAEMKRAESAIDAAKDAGAKEYAAEKLKSAEDALAEGKKLMDRWQYKKARDKFEEAYRLAEEARQIALNAPRGEEPAPPPYVPPPPPPVKKSDTHTVVKGECLWWIAESKEVYSDPFQWPVIYDANRDLIDAKAKASGLPYMKPDGWAHWIFPGQNLEIPRDVSTEAIKDARKRAGAPAPYLPPGQ